ncbi:oligosaccharide flippase family protein [Escherichia coli]|nr:oligosaccharide flippase family protein [Escherichia coli]
MSSIKRNIAALTIVQLVSYLSPLLALPYLSRVLNVDSFGLVMLIIAILNITMTFTDFGFNIFSAYWIAKNKNNKNRVALHLGSVFIIKFILILICISLVYFYLYIFDNLSLSLELKNKLFIWISISILFLSYQPTWFFQGIEKMFNITLFMSASKLSYILFVIFLVKNENDISWVIASYSFSNMIASILGMYFIYKNGYYIRIPSYNFCIDVFKKSSQFFLSRVSVVLYTSANTFIVGNIGGLQQSAFYSSSEKIYQFGQSLSAPISQALFPHLVRTKEKRTLYKFVFTMLIPLTIGTSIIYYFAQDIITLIFSTDFIDATPTLRVLLICIIVNFIGVNFGYPAFSIINRIDLANKTVIAGSLLQLVLILFLYTNNLVSAYSIAVSVLITEGFVMLSRIIIYKHYSKKKHYEI